jgi:hypothetical protein
VQKTVNRSPPNGRLEKPSFKHSGNFGWNQPQVKTSKKISENTIDNFIVNK